jgi:hypothetical protein
MEGGKDMGTDTLNEQLLLFPYKKDIVYDLEADTRECRDCKETLPLNKFKIKNIMSDNLGVLARVCYNCDKKRLMESYERRKSFKYPDENYCCPICLKDEKQLKKIQIVVDVNTYKIKEHKNKRKNVWRLDHDHITGGIRGWLCNSCNVSKGQLGDTLESAERLVKYYKGGLNGSTRV